MGEATRPLSGLLVISGSTKSLKTKLALGLIHIHLEDLMRQWLRDHKARRPHLITCEDDNETYFTELNWLLPVEQAYKTPRGHPLNLWFSDVDMPDYTPRRLVEGLSDSPLKVAALR
jgi:hypothetical protein